VAIVAMLEQVMWPQLTEQDLHRVREIEDQIIPVVVEMEHNGAFLDVETLTRWCKEAKQDLDNAMWRIAKATGVSMISPTNKADLRRLFSVLNIAPPIDPETTGDDGDLPSASQTRCWPIKHPVITDLRLRHGARQPAVEVPAEVPALDGPRRHPPLRAAPAAVSGRRGGRGGAVSGRFSSAAPSKEEGANIQQVIGVKKQQGTKDKVTGEYTGFTRKYIIKSLFKPRQPGAVWLKADASQFQFRLFAHYASHRT
jgi:hypothetical protein